MVSSLAAQLAQGASLNASLLADRTKRKPTESYLFTGRDADLHDLDSIYALGCNGLLQLRSLDRRFATFTETLFSDSARNLDRTLQPSEANEGLNATIRNFLVLLGPFLLEAPSGKALEWLVKRFRIHEFNVDDLAALFLPYHESPHFAKMVTILHVKERSHLSFLRAYKAAAKPLSRDALVVEMFRTHDLARFVCSLLSGALDAGAAHHTMTAFHTGTVLGFINSAKSLSNGVVAMLLPALLAPLKTAEAPGSQAKDLTLSSYVLLTALSHKCTLSPAALKAIVAAMCSGASRVSTKQLLHAVVAVCAPQDEVDGFSEKMIKVVSDAPDFCTAFVESLRLTGAERFACPVIETLAACVPGSTSVTVLQSVFTAPQAPVAIVRRCASALIRRTLALGGAETESHIACRRLLSTLQQRRPAVLEKVAADMVEDAEDAAGKSAVEQLVISLAMMHGSADGEKKNDVIFASTNADATVRAASVRELYGALADAGAADSSTIRSALFTRLHDTSSAVLEALYNDPSSFLPISSADPMAYITTLAQVLSPPPPASLPRAVLRLHLNFLCTHFLPAHGAAQPALLATAFEQIVFRLLLLSKPRQKTAGIVWEMVGPGADGAGFELLAGCWDVYKWEEGKEKDQPLTAQVMARINIAVAARMAENIIASNDFEKHFAFLVGNLQASDAHASALAYLVVRALLSRLPAEGQISAALRTLDAMNLLSLDEIGGFMDGSGNMQSYLSDEGLGMSVVLKPSSKHTKHRLQAALLALLPLIPRPRNTTLDWLSDAVSNDADNEAGPQYVQLMRKVYILANSTSSLPLLSTNLVRALFIKLGPSALVFLEGIWTAAKASDRGTSEDAEPHRHAALCHALAFFSAYQGTEQPQDFQTVLPSIIVLLQNPSQVIREVAVECLQLLMQMSTAQKPSSVYEVDTIYGRSSEKLLFITWEDQRKYLQAIVDHRDHLIGNEDAIVALQHQHLTKKGGDTRKEIGYKERVLSYLLSHIVSCPHLGLRLLLLKTLGSVRSPIKARVLLPTIQTEGDAAAAPSRVRVEETTALVTGSLDASMCADLNTTNASTWSMLVAVIRYTFAHAVLAQARTAIIHALSHGLYTGLSLDRKLQVSELLLELGARGSDEAVQCKTLLVTLLQEVEVITRLLQSFRPLVVDAAARSAKRPKLDVGLAVSIEDRLASLTLLAEVVASRPLPGSMDLIVCLLDSIADATHSDPTSGGDVAYVEQLFMTAIDQCSAKLLESENPAAEKIRLDVLVELIRSAGNAQTSHQALALVANMARLAPESVLHNIMPLFTFMGANVFHRDDDFSFSIVQKTTDSILPVMSASLKKSHPDQQDLWSNSKEFLQIFTGAANHVPRHRRTNFFSHVVDSLGPDDFLTPICLLLVAKHANRVVKQNMEDMQSTMSLPLILMQKYRGSLQVQVITDILCEAGRGMSTAADPEGHNSPFLTSAPDDDDDLLPTLSRRRAQALVLFAACALKQAPNAFLARTDIPSQDVESLLSQLLALSSITAASTDLASIAGPVRMCLRRTVDVMSATDFVKAMVVMLKSEDASMNVGAVELIASRLDSISETVRAQSAVGVNKITGRLVDLISSTSNRALREGALEALRVVSLSPGSQEGGSLAKSVETVLGVIQSRTSIAPALAALRPLVIYLGPRIIPQFQMVVKECVGILRERLVNNTGSHVPSTDDVVGVLLALLVSIPTFWGSAEVTPIITLHLNFPELSQGAYNSIIKALPKKLPSKILLPTLSAIWTSADGVEKTQQVDSGRTTSYMQVFKRVLRTAPRPDVLQHLRPLFNVFLEAFESQSSDEKSGLDKEDSATQSAFLELVVKLNEGAFRPLFRRLYDWAFAGDSTRVGRKITFLRTYGALLDFFNGLMTPYMSTLLQPMVDILDSFTASEEDSDGLWLSLIATLTKALSSDDGGFWREDKLRVIATPLIQQIAVCMELDVADERATLSDCLSALVEVVSEDALLKKINLGVLMHTRSEDPHLRSFALNCAEILWKAHGGKLLGFVPETATFIAECAEDEIDAVVHDALKLRDAVESVAGSISQM